MNGLLSKILEQDVFKAASPEDAKSREEQREAQLGPDVYAPYTEDKQHVTITCPHCGNMEEHPKDEQRWHTQHFTFLDNWSKGDDSYTLYDCNRCDKTFKIKNMFEPTPLDEWERKVSQDIFKPATKDDINKREVQNDPSKPEFYKLRGMSYYYVDDEPQGCDFCLKDTHYQTCEEDGECYYACPECIKKYGLPHDEPLEEAGEDIFKPRSEADIEKTEKEKAAAKEKERQERLARKEECPHCHKNLREVGIQAVGIRGMTQTYGWNEDQGEWEFEDEDSGDSDIDEWQCGNCYNRIKYNVDFFMD